MNTLKVGDKVPPFTVNDHLGNSQSLEQYKGSKRARELRLPDSCLGAKLLQVLSTTAPSGSRRCSTCERAVCISWIGTLQLQVAHPQSLASTLQYFSTKHSTENNSLVENLLGSTI